MNLYIIPVIALGLSGCICDIDDKAATHASDDDDSTLPHSYTHPDVLRADLERFRETFSGSEPTKPDRDQDVPQLNGVPVSLSHDEVFTTLDEVKEVQFRPLLRGEFLETSASADNTDRSTPTGSVSNSFQFSGLHKALSEFRPPLVSEESASTLIDSDLNTSDLADRDTPELHRTRTNSIGPILFQSAVSSSPSFVQSVRSLQHSLASSYRDRRMSLEEMIAAGYFEPKAHESANVQEAGTTSSPEDPDDETNGTESDEDSDILFHFELPTTP
jgi:hypothetical protein